MYINVFHWTRCSEQYCIVHCVKKNTTLYNLFRTLVYCALCRKLYYTVHRIENCIAWYTVHRTVLHCALFTELYFLASCVQICIELCSLLYCTMHWFKNCTALTQPHSRGEKSPPRLCNIVSTIFSSYFFFSYMFHKGMTKVSLPQQR